MCSARSVASHHCVPCKYARASVMALLSQLLYRSIPFLLLLRFFRVYCGQRQRKKKKLEAHNQKKKIYFLCVCETTSTRTVSLLLLHIFLFFRSTSSTYTRLNTATYLDYNVRVAVFTLRVVCTIAATHITDTREQQRSSGGKAGVPTGPLPLHRTWNTHHRTDCTAQPSRFAFV